jgi:hypothetical protein
VLYRETHILLEERAGAVLDGSRQAIHAAVLGWAAQLKQVLAAITAYLMVRQLTPATLGDGKAAHQGFLVPKVHSQ